MKGQKDTEHTARSPGRKQMEEGNSIVNIIHGSLRVGAALCGVALIGVAGNASALGIGEPDVRSHLGQPLAVRVPLQLSAAERIDDIALTLSPDDAYTAMGLQPPPAALRSANLRVRIEEGKPWLLLDGTARIFEPFVVVLVEARSGGTRLLRELTLMIEPPALTPAPSQRRPAPSVPPVEAAPAIVAVAVPELLPTPAEAIPLTQPGEGRYGPTVAGETLRGVAERVRPEPKFGIRRVMTALLLANPETLRGTQQALTAGIVLSVPTPAYMLELSSAQIDAAVGPRPRGASVSQSPGEQAPAESEAVTATTETSADPTPAALPATAPASPRLVTPYGSLRLSADLSDRSLGRLSAGAAGPVPAQTAPEPVVSEELPADMSQAASDAIAAPAVVASDVVEPVETPAASQLADAKVDGGSGRSWIAWLLLALITAGLAVWRRARITDRPVWARLRIPVATDDTSAPARAAPAAPATATTSPTSTTSATSAAETAVVPPLRVVGGIETRDAGLAASLRQRAERLSRSTDEPIAVRRLTLVHAYLDNADTDSAEQLLTEIEQPPRSARAAANS